MGQVRRLPQETIRGKAEDVVTKFLPQPASPGDGVHGDALPPTGVKYELGAKV